MIHLRRTLLALAILATGWALVAAFTGGLRFTLGELRVSARGAQNPLIAATVLMVLALLVAPRGRRRLTVASDLSPLSRGLTAASAIVRPAWIAAFAAAVVVATACAEGAFAVGGSDSYGYVSQARMWTRGMMSVDEPLLGEFGDRFPREAFVPLGWRPAEGGEALLPAYSAGLPLAMSLFERIGGADAVYYVIPLLSGVCVWATFLLGRAVGGPPIGAAAAVLLAASPAFLAQATSAPMSDLPAAAWWTLAMALVTIDRPAAAAAAGLAAGAAILTRPNLAPLALAPALVAAWPALAARRIDARTARRVLLLGAGTAAGCAGVAALNAAWFGSPLQTGYGALDQLYGWRHFWGNVAHFSTWLAEGHTPLLAIAGWGAFQIRTPIAMATALLGVLAIVSYLFYTPFDDWLYLRFLLPAFPPLMVFFSVAIDRLARRFAPVRHAAFMAVAVLVLAAFGISSARARSVFETAHERRYAAVGRHVDAHLPPRAVVFSMLHSGSIRHYGNRATVRWDLLPLDRFDELADTLRQTGRAPYLALEPWEADQLARRFGRPLEWPLIAETRQGDVAIYEMSRRDAAASGDGRIAIIERE